LMHSLGQEMAWVCTPPPPPSLPPPHCPLIVRPTTLPPPARCCEQGADCFNLFVQWGLDQVVLRCAPQPVFRNCDEMVAIVTKPGFSGRKSATVWAGAALGAPGCATSLAGQ
jgi:hypothetical protein